LYDERLLEQRREIEQLRRRVNEYELHDLWVAYNDTNLTWILRGLDEIKTLARHGLRLVEWDLGAWGRLDYRRTLEGTTISLKDSEEIDEDVDIVRIPGFGLDDIATFLPLGIRRRAKSIRDPKVLAYRRFVEEHGVDTRMEVFRNLYGPCE
jgi:hypothetical protein